MGPDGRLGDGWGSRAHGAACRDPAHLEDASRDGDNNLAEPGEVGDALLAILDSRLWYAAVGH